eukprot:TRINITY_DN65172_c0_g1_i1.p1 TRINITY_DN65172_c0_g1~~TRINITY_DN65172_c0_g1_i1.p1  ORF type:complete len:693 (-),score=231.15 TRINITY_DN65172_c0_g1_i1:24-2054(-)
MASFTACLLLAFLCTGYALKLNSTGPSEKVVEMLKQLKSDVTAEGQKEEAEFKESEMLCAKTQDEKRYQIGRSEQKMTKLEAEIGVLAGDVQVVATDLERLRSDVSNLEGEMSTAASDRAKELETYENATKEIDGSLQALDKAIASISTTKSSDAAVGLAALKGLASKVLGTAAHVSLVELSSSQLDNLDTLSAASPSQDIVALLNGLKSTFKSNKHRLELEELEAKGTHDKLMMNLRNQIKFLKQDMNEKTLVSSKKTAKKAELSKDLLATNSSKASDHEFLQSFIQDCNDKAEMAKQRGEMREKELAALSAAIEKLGEGGVSMVQFRSSKDQTVLSRDLQASKSAKVQKLEPAPSLKQASKTFLQMRETKKESSHEHDIEKLEVLAMKVPSISLLVEKARNSTDPLAEVRKLIKDLIERKETTMAQEGNTSTFCNEQLPKQTEQTGDLEAAVERLNVEMDSSNATLRTTRKELADVLKDVSELTVEIEEATKLRAEEKKATELDLKKAQEGEEATSSAYAALSDFYKGPVLLQTAAQARNYSQEAAQRSMGALALLEALVEDFKESVTTLKAQEAKAVDAFEELKMAYAADKDSKETEAEAKTAEISSLEDSLLQAQGDLTNAQDALKLAKGELAKLESMCGGEDSAAAQALQRQESIQVLKDTLDHIDTMVSL